jgi:hypothetical protein
LHDHGIPLGAGLEVVLVALLAAVELRRRRSPVTAQPTAGLRGLLRGVLLIGVIAIPVLLAINEVSKVKPRRPRAVHLPPVRLPTRSAAPHQLAGHSGGASAAPVLYALLAIALLAAVVACVIALRRRARAVAWDDGDEMIDEEPEQQLRRAVESGQAALGHIDDARLAIIACYLAMERSLAKAGAVRADAETPDELLDRAAQAGLVAGAEAAELTALFYEARFSSHAMPPAKREAASRALAALAQSIPDEARTPLAETPSGGAPPGEAPS